MFSLVVLLIIQSGILKSQTKTVELFLLVFAVFKSLNRWVYSYGYIFLVNWFLRHYEMLLFFSNNIYIFCCKFYFVLRFSSHFMVLIFAVCVVYIFPSFWFHLICILNLKYFSDMWYIIGYCFCNLSEYLRVAFMMFGPRICSVVIDMSRFTLV